MFLLKAGWLGLVGGVGGCVAGMVLALVLGPYWAGVEVSPLPLVGLVAVAAALGTALPAALWPARRAAAMDPCACFREV
jgi:ABC-type antimicrobial peptide transport system permease subunit